MGFHAHSAPSEASPRASTPAASDLLGIWFETAFLMLDTRSLGGKALQH